MMEWFKHDSGATQDAKIKKLLIRHGAIGYAVYFHCLELITSDISASNITFQLEHDSEIIADNLRIRGTGDKSGIEIVEDIMKTILDLDLFQISNNRIYCLKMVKRLDSSMTSNTKMRKLISDSKEYHDTVMTGSCKNRIEENRIEENIATPTKSTYDLNGIDIPINTTTHKQLITEYGEHTILDYYERVHDYSQSADKKYKDYAATARNWIKRDIQQGKGPAKQKAVIEKVSCPVCGFTMTATGCNICGLDRCDLDNESVVDEFRTDYERRTKK